MQRLANGSSEHTINVGKHFVYHASRVSCDSRSRSCAQLSIRSLSQLSFHACTTTWRRLKRRIVLLCVRVGGMRLPTTLQLLEA